MHLTHFDMFSIGNDVSSVNPPKIKDWSFVASPYSNFRYGLTQNEAYDSDSSLYIVSKLPIEKGFAAIRQKISAQNYLNSKLKLTAYVKTTNMTGNATVELNLFDERDSLLRRGRVQIEPGSHQQDWQKVEIVADVSENIKSISYAGYLLGSGQVWFDEFNLSTATKDEADTTINMQEQDSSDNNNSADKQKYLDITGYNTLPSEQLAVGKQPLECSKWHISEYLINEYEFKFDNDALLLESVDSDADFGVFYRRYLITQETAKAVKFSAKIKRQYVSTMASIWVRIEDKDNRNIAFDNLQYESIGGSTDWRPIEVVLPLKYNAEVISFGTLLIGNGKMWLKDPQIELLDSYPKNNDDTLLRPSNMGFE